jgi:hypothetical protein
MKHDLLLITASLWLSQSERHSNHSDIERSRCFLFSKEFFIFELSSRRRRQAKKILKFRAAAADQVIGLHL